MRTPPSQLQHNWRDPVMEGNPRDTSYASYMAPLVACLAATTGNVLELGLGFWSTPFLHRYCLATNRMLVSMDSDQDWAARLMHMDIPGHHHVINCRGVDYDSEIQRCTDRKWSVALLDHSPGWRRAADAVTLASCCEYILVHDYSGSEIADGFNAAALAHWQSIQVATYSPTTLVLSNRDMPWWPKSHNARWNPAS